MTPANLARHRTNPNIAFWRMIKEGNDHFEVSHLEPKVDVCNKHYVFDAAPPPNSSKPITFNPTGRCPQFVVAPDIAGPAHAKEVADNAAYASLVKENVAVAPVHSGLDGGMNRVFLAQVGGNIPPARVQPPDALPQQPPPVTTADGSGQPSLASRLFGGLFSGNTATQVAATDTSTKEHGAEAAKPKSSRSETAVANAKLRTGEKTAEKTAEKPTRPPVAEPAKPAPQIAVAKPKPDAQQQEANAAPPSGAVMKGAQPPVATGSFDSRWSALQ